jgi:ubiquinone/menaquinone biosynthesis C-methylase UbiE
MDKHEPLLGGCRIVDGQSGDLPYLQHLARYEFAAEYVKGKRVLDVACGTGYGSRRLAEAGADSVIGLDISSEAVCYATEHYRAGNLSFRVGDAEHIEVDNATVDVVVSFETIEHLSRPEQYLAEVSRVMTAEGLFLVSTPNRRLTSPWRPLKRPVSPFHVQEWLPEEFYAMLCSRFRHVEKLGQIRIANRTRQVWETLCRQRLNRWLVKPAYRLFHGTGWEEMARKAYRSICGPDKDRHGDVPTGTAQSGLERQRTHFRVAPAGEGEEFLVLLAVCSKAEDRRAPRGRKR